MTARTGLPAYTRFFAVDFLVQRAALPLAMVVVLTGIPLYTIMQGQPGLFASPDGPGFARQFFTNICTLFLPVAAFLGGAGVMSTDRHHGYVRFYFSRPVRVPSYYAYAYALHGALLVLLFGALTWGFGALTVHQSVHRAMEAAALTFLLVGGLGFLFGAVLRHDGAFLALAYLGALATQQVVAQSPLAPAWMRQVARVLPPVQQLDGLRNQLYAGQPLDIAQLWHVLGYGAGAYIIGLVILRRTPLVR